ncbi:UDP-glucose 4-epimerase GalE [Cereibacter azotoformans]|uniref:UDP-glucose 4-epimerase n=1 Tax=Cereibacter azotoformans TaxID=43057 RepID=A0A2T5JVV2_9RHOB|nr:UDP-glucose 4-epimerase GalE [Cereibacter azotoformans]PTR14307.1 UDP-galactose 4-epimerase [Cereibacter azotoformans]
MSDSVLLAGGAGYIGSHVVTALASAGWRPVILDNFDNSEPEVVERIEEITGCRVPLIEGDVRDRALVERALRRHRIGAVVHLAGRKSVNESAEDPLLYFAENLSGAVSLMTAMRNCGVSRLVFSSSATVYGAAETLPVDETAPTRVTSPYGRTKLMIEEMIDDCVAAVPEFSAVSLRYFNPVGAHRSGLIGEVPRGLPNNLFPYVVRAATGELPFVRVFGNDYPTPDGTGLRDYIHVEDLARGHVAALRVQREGPGLLARHQRINLGTGRGHTVLEVLDAFGRACGFRIPRRIVGRRPGDVAASVADPGLAQRLLGWQARHGLDEMCESQWIFQQRHAERLERAPALPHLPVPAYAAPAHPAE